MFDTPDLLCFNAWMTTDTRRNPERRGFEMLVARIEQTIAGSAVNVIAPRATTPFAALVFASGRVIGQTHHRVKHYVKLNNETHALVWSKTADDILASIERFCMQTPNSRH